ncbi:hypothetical protein HK407_12g18730 [Ordospora pajunii]|uniref:uncharacterized protein n=1 Tax=Ordospora pajunii TaxID=3039483 RepID=UPI0029527FA3|nr:uncharacterized protein HK407_12g18730 [Ordospora pajunii]KAH9410741.1 hypothetical protein HK407_12g18730 [Ordospora pajunii]
MELLGYFGSADDAKDVVPVVLAVLNGTMDEDLSIKVIIEALVPLMEKEKNKLLVYVLNAIINKEMARVVVQLCVMCMEEEVLAETVNNIKDKEIVYYMMEVLKQKGMLMNEEILSRLKHDTTSVVLCGVPSASDKPGLVESHEAAEILSYFMQHDPASTEMLKCMRGQDKDAIDNMMKDIKLAEELNKIKADDINELNMRFNNNGRSMTVMLFKHLNDEVMQRIVHVIMDANEKKSFLIDLSNSEAMRKSRSTDKNTADLDVQQRINKVWQVYGVDSVSNLLLPMSDDERNKVLKQLGHKHEIDALIYVGTKNNYRIKVKEGRMKDVRMIFDAIEDERRKELLNDIINEKEGLPYYNTDTFNKLMDVLKEASVEYKEVAYMLLGIKYKNWVTDMITRISTEHGDKYVADILLSIHNYNDLKSVISDIKHKPTLIARILGKADDIDKLSRLFNIIVSDDIINRKMQIVLDKLVINKNIVNELIHKPKDEQNNILGAISNTQLVNKINCAIKKAQEQKRRRLGIATIVIVIAVAVIVIETVFTGMSIKDALNNGNAMSDEAVISRILMAAVTIVMMLSVIAYVNCANKPVWYDRLMIGGSVVMALMRVLMDVYGGVNVNECVEVRVINALIVVMSAAMAIRSVVAVINSKIKNAKSDGTDESNDASGITRSVIVVLSTCVMTMTGWVIQRMSSQVNNEMLH